MPRLSFTLRDVFWLTLVVAVAMGWWADRKRLDGTIEKMEESHAAASSLQSQTFRALLRAANESASASSP
jgi:hypothetical protein